MKARTTRKCVVCGAPFAGVGHRNKLCSEPCRATRQKQQISRWHREHTDYWRIKKAEQRRKLP